MPQDKRPLVIGRRTFLTVTAATAGVLLLRRCDRARPTGDYFDLLREAQRRLRTSPDHVPARIQRLAAAGDVRGLVDYLRRHFAVLPSNPAGWVSVLNGQRWGTRGVMRARAGTMREITQMLADVLNEAGIEATPVSSTQRNSSQAFLVNPEPLPFQPAEGPDDLFAWSGAKPTPPPVPLDDEAAERMAAAALAALDPAGFRPFETRELQSALPDVRIGSELAGLWTETMPTTPAPEYLVELGDVRRAPPARFTVSIVPTRDPSRPVEVVDATFGLDELAGRRVDVAFVPPAESVEDLLQMRPADAMVFIPTLRVAGLDLKEDERARLYAEGKPFSLEGDLFEETENGLTLGNGRLGTSGDPAQVQSVQIKRVVTAHYPRLEVEFDALDATGATVANIDAEQFVVEDGDANAPMMLRRTETPPPSIVFVVDKSLSMPEQYREAGAQRVVTGIAEEVSRRHPDARFRVALVGVDGAGLLGWRTDPAQVGADTRSFGMGSGLWHSYVEAAQSGGNIIVFLTDGNSANRDNVAQDEPPIDLIPALAAAPPAIMLGTGDLGTAFAGIATITQGVALAIDDQDEAIREVLEQIESYRQSYDALVLANGETEGEERELRLLLRGLNISTSARYVVPPNSAREPGAGLAGIHLRVEANGIVCHRTLAGIPYRVANDPVSADPEEVRQALIGSYSVITEAGAPSPSQILDDVFEELLSWEAVFEATTPQAAIAAIQQAQELPHGAFAFSVPVSSDGPLTWDTGLRMWLSTERLVPRGEKTVVRRSVDLLPVTRFMTSGVSPAEAVATTVRRTAQLAAYEAAIYDRAALPRLTGALVPPVENEMSADQQAGYRTMRQGWPPNSRFAVNPEVEAAVAVDRETGTLIAVMPDGSGGGVTEEEIERDFKQVIALVEMAGSVGALSAWSKLEKAKLEKLRIATLIIHRMNVQGIIDLLHDEACKKIGKKITAGGLAGLRHASPAGSRAIELIRDAAKDFKRWGDAAGIPPAIPTDLKPC